MRKIFMLLALSLIFISCEKKEDIELSKSDIVGIWNVTKITSDGETTNLPSVTITVDLKSDDKYSVSFFGDSYAGTYTIDGSTVIGVSGSIIEYFEFTSFSGNKAKIDYKNSDGDIYQFEAEKK